MEVNDIVPWIKDNLPEVTLIVGGIIAILIVATYLKDKDSYKYKFMALIGLVFGVFMAYEAVTNYGEWKLVTSVIVAVAAFAMIIRPFRDVHFAVIIALMVMIIVYMWLGGITEVYGIDISFISENPARVILAFIIAGLVYSVLSFGEAIVMGVGKLLNCWPLLLLLGCICVVEGALMLTGNGSIMDYVNELR